VKNISVEFVDCKFVCRCGRSDADVTEASDFDNTFNTIPLSQLLMEMDKRADSSEASQQPYQCQCITDEHQPACVRIEHFTVSPDDQTSLSNIAGNLSDFMHLVASGITVGCICDHAPAVHCKSDNSLRVQ